MTLLITILLLVTVGYALIRYARDDGLAVLGPRFESRDELDHLRPPCIAG